MNLDKKHWQPTDKYNLSDYIRLKTNMEELNSFIKAINPQYVNNFTLKTYIITSYIYKDFFNDILNYLENLTSFCEIPNEMIWRYSEFDNIFSNDDVNIINGTVERVYEFLVEKYNAHENILKAGAFSCSSNKILQITRG